MAYDDATDAAIPARPAGLGITDRHIVLPYGDTPETAATTPKIYYPNVAPEGFLTGNPGDIAIINVSSAGTIYIKATGSGNTGWQLLRGGSEGNLCELSGWGLDDVAVDVSLVQFQRFDYSSNGSGLMPLHEARMPFDGELLGASICLSAAIGAGSLTIRPYLDDVAGSNLDMVFSGSIRHVFLGTGYHADQDFVAGEGIQPGYFTSADWSPTTNDIRVSFWIGRT